MNPGIYAGIPNEDYHAGPGYSKSQLDLARKSPALVQWSRRAPRSFSDADHMGSGFHCLLLEPERFATDYGTAFKAPAHALSTVDDIRSWLDERGVEYKKSDTKGVLKALAYETDPNVPLVENLQRQWETGRSGTVLSDAEWATLHEMRDSALAHPEAASLLSLPGESELSAYATDPDTGLLVRIRPDRWSRQYRIMVDVKTADDVAKFQWSVRDYRYDVQAAFYPDVAALAAGEPLDAFLFLVVGKRREMGRYPVRIIELHPDHVEDARDEYRRDLAVIAECERNGYWPGVETMTVPPRRNY